MRYATHYNMNNPKRGLAMIFNHEFFTTNHLKSRSGTNVDCETLRNCLLKLGFEVKDYQNLVFKDIQKNLEKGISLKLQTHLSEISFLN